MTRSPSSLWPAALPENRRRGSAPGRRPSVPSSIRSRCLFPAALIGSFALLGCGHPATQEECDAIVARVAELALKQKPMPAVSVERAVAEAKRDFKPAALKDCVGKRITARALRCIQNAETYEEIENSCF